MVTKSQRLNRQLIESFEPILQPLKTVLLFAATATFFWWIAGECLGEQLPSISSVIPEALSRLVMSWFR